MSKYDNIPEQVYTLPDGRMICAERDDDISPFDFDDEIWQSFEAGDVKIYVCYILTHCKCCKHPEESEHVSAIVAKNPQEAIQHYIENYLDQ